tara:strand:- start:10971 stop:11354 length:384 start_codon:yes stop_codon:yes gene_type:complete
MERSNKLIAVGAIMAALAVAFGAFGAHAVKDMVSPERLGNWETAAQYHFYHAIAIVLVGLVARDKKSSFLKWSGILFFVGILFFSFSLYTLALTNITWLGAITPLGGVAFILGWLFLAKECIPSKKD